MTPPTMDLGDVRLRPLRRNDAAEWHAYLSDPLVTEFTSYAVMSLEDVGAMVERCLAGYAAGTSCTWAIADRTDDRLIGTCGFNVFALAEGRAELSYDLARRYWGRGLAPRAVVACLDWAFDHARLDEVHALVMAGNARSERVLQSAGFTRGPLLEAFRTRQGHARDYWVFTLAREDWEAGRQNRQRS